MDPDLGPRRGVDFCGLRSFKTCRSNSASPPQTRRASQLDQDENDAVNDVNDLVEAKKRALTNEPCKFHFASTTGKR